MDDTPRYIHIQLISEVRKTWHIKSIKKDRINNPRAKDLIREHFPATDIRDWKKEYSIYSHYDRSMVEIHRFVNKLNHKEEFGVKLKRIIQKHDALKFLIESLLNRYTS